MDQLASSLGSSAPHPLATNIQTHSFRSPFRTWKDYLERFHTFASANSVPKDKMAQIYLTNQTTATYKLSAPWPVNKLLHK